MKFNKKTGEIRDEMYVKDTEGWKHLLDSWFPVFHPLTHKYLGYISDNKFTEMYKNE